MNDNGPRVATNPVTEFTRTKGSIESPVWFYEIWVAVWHNGGRGEVLIGAPTRMELAARWEQLTASKIDINRAQRVAVTYYDYFKPSST